MNEMCDIVGCDFCGSETNLVFAPDPYVLEFYPEDPGSKKKITMCEECYRGRLDAI